MIPPHLPFCPATGLLISRKAVYLHDPQMERRRGSEGDETIGGVLFLLSRPDLLFVHLCPFLTASQGVVTEVCVYVCVDWLYLSISCVKVSRPGGSYMKGPLKSL